MAHDGNGPYHNLSSARLLQTGAHHWFKACTQLLALSLSRNACGWPWCGGKRITPREQVSKFLTHSNILDFCNQNLWTKEASSVWFKLSHQIPVGSSPTEAIPSSLCERVVKVLDSSQSNITRWRFPPYQLQMCRFGGKALFHPKHGTSVLHWIAYDHFRHMPCMDSHGTRGFEVSRRPKRSKSPVGLPVVGEEQSIP
jgi:hypothetical protein